jgi:ribosomal protein S18 acetylase RimI-like enzyme
MQPAWILYDLFVDPRVRRCGAGRMLMLRAAQYARSSGASYIALDTAADNQPAQALYESLGYQQDPDFLSYSLKIR